MILILAVINSCCFILCKHIHAIYDVIPMLSNMLMSMLMNPVIYESHYLWMSVDLTYSPLTSSLNEQSYYHVFEFIHIYPLCGILLWDCSQFGSCSISLYNGDHVIFVHLQIEMSDPVKKTWVFGMRTYIYTPRYCVMIITVYLRDTCVHPSFCFSLII